MRIRSSREISVKQTPPYLRDDPVKAMGEAMNANPPPAPQTDPLKCHVGDWIPASAPVVANWNRRRGVYWYLVGGFVKRRMEGAGPVNPATPWGFELRRNPALGGDVWVRSS